MKILSAEEFVDSYKEIVQPENVYIEAGLSKDYVENIISKYRIKLKGSPRIEQSNPVLSLIDNYDVSNLEIGMISFSSSILRTKDYILFGKDEVDDLAIDIATNEIVVLENNQKNVIQYCATNGDSFLSAILEMAKFLEKRSLNDQLFNDESANVTVAKKCAQLAGGEKYSDYFIMMTGF